MHIGPNIVDHGQGARRPGRQPGDHQTGKEIDVAHHGSYRHLAKSLDMNGLTARPIKRSLTLQQHRTSVSLESEFWDVFRQIAARDGKTLNGLAAEIDRGRGDVGLASAIRVFVLRRALQDQSLG